MSFMSSIQICFQKFYNFSGRASRSEFLYFTLFVFIIGLTAINIDAALTGETFSTYEGAFGPAETLYLILTLLPSFSVSVRRLHDIGRSG